MGHFKNFSGNGAADKEQYLKILSNLSTDTLKILADLSQKPNIEKKLKEKHELIKLFI